MGLLLLGILKFAGFGIAAVSTIWGLTRRTTYDDEHGRRRLTPAGQVSIALAVGACLVATMSLGFETLSNMAKAQQAAVDEQRARDEKMAARLQAEADRRTADERELRRVADERARAAEARSANLEQRNLILLQGEDERRRDLALARSVSKGAQENLSRTELALAQIERLLEPVEKVQITLTWALPPDAPGVAEATATIRDLAARVRKGEPQALAAVGMQGTAPAYAARFPNLVITSGLAAYPTAARDPVLYGAMQRAGARVSVFAGGVPTTEGLAVIANAPDSNVGPIYRIGDLRYSLGGSMPALIYDYATGVITFEARVSSNTVSTSTGAIVSVADLKKATIAIDSMAGAKPSSTTSGEKVRQLRLQLRPQRLQLYARSRVFDLDAARFRVTPAPNAYFVYTAGPLGEPTEPRPAGP